MDTRQANSYELEKALALAYRLQEGVSFLDAHEVRFENGVLSVDLINGDPYIVDLTNGQIYTFPSEPKSGTDALRKRMEHRLFEKELLAERDRPTHYLGATLTADRILDIERLLERGSVVVGLDRLVNRGGVIELHLAHGSGLHEFESVSDALTHIIVREQGEEGVAELTWPRPRG